MKKVLILLVCFFSASVFASEKSFDLKIDLALNGEHISSPRIIVKPGELAAITQKNNTDEFFIEVVATEGFIQNHKGIMMNFVVGVIDKNGERVIKAKPQVLTKENESAQITVDKNNEDEIFLSVVANRISL